MAAGIGIAESCLDLICGGRAGFRGNQNWMGRPARVSCVAEFRFLTEFSEMGAINSYQGHIKVPVVRVCDLERNRVSHHRLGNVSVIKNDGVGEILPSKSAQAVKNGMIIRYAECPSCLE